MQETLLSMNEQVTTKVDLSEMVKGAYEGMAVGILRLHGATDLNYPSGVLSTFDLKFWYDHKMSPRDMKSSGLEICEMKLPWSTCRRLMDSYHPCDEEEGKDAFVPWDDVENLLEGSKFDLGEQQDKVDSKKAKKDAKGKAKLHKEESQKKHSKPKVQGKKENKGNVSTSQKRKRPKETGKTTLGETTSVKKMKDSVPHNIARGDGGNDPPKKNREKEIEQEEFAWKKAKKLSSKELKKLAQGEVERQNVMLQGEPSLHQHSKQRKRSKRRLWKLRRVSKRMQLRRMMVLLREEMHLAMMWRKSSIRLRLVVKWKYMVKSP
eukprot:Gb_30453 [translate_table: standard]